MPVIHLRIVGRVQGVGFRWFVHDHATALGVAGWVKNTSSGDVELVASGPEEELSSLERVVSRGPAGAHVTSVHRLPPAPGVTYPSPFRIER